MVTFSYSPLGSFFRYSPQCSMQLMASRQKMAPEAIREWMTRACSPKIRQIRVIQQRVPATLQTAQLLKNPFPLFFSAQNTPFHELSTQFLTKLQTFCPFCAEAESSGVDTNLWWMYRWWQVKWVQYRLVMWRVPSTRQNLPGLCMTSWAMANWTEYLFEEMKMMPTRGMTSPQLSSRVEKRMRNLMLMVQERIIARQSVIRKNPSSLSNCFRSQGVGFRQSRLKTSSRMGKRAQTTAMRMKAILEQEFQVEKRLTMLSRERVQQGRELMMSEFLPKRSMRLLGRHCSSLAIIPPYLNLPKRKRLLALC